jgi:uncharacterized protein YggE
MQTNRVDRPWGVSAYGTAVVRARPDVVRARFKVTRTEQTPSAAFAVASDAVTAVREALRQHGVPDSAVDRSRLGLASSWTYGTTREFAGYVCEASFSVESTALDNVQPLLVDVVAAGANEIEGVEFDIAGKSDLRAEARAKAVAAARTKAELYADAAGVRLGPVVHIEEADPEQPAAALYRGHDMAAGGASADLAPGFVVVTAVVMLGFSIAHP